MKKRKPFNIHRFMSVQKTITKAKVFAASMLLVQLLFGIIELSLTGNVSALVLGSTWLLGGVLSALVITMEYRQWMMSRRVMDDIFNPSARFADSKRDHKIKNKFRPESYDELMSLIEHAPKKDLIDMGCLMVKSESSEGDIFPAKDETMYLLPKEWYDKLPDGAKFYTPTGDELFFEKGVTSKQAIKGCLGYGFIRKESENEPSGTA